jgi:predicted anti-sigma-YlaC factor YlaD
MMNCRQIAEDEVVEKYLTGRLESSLQDDFEIHVLECHECLVLLETCEAARTELAARATEIRQMPERSGAALAGLRWGWLAPQRLAGFAGLATLLVIVVFLAVRGGRPSGPTEAQSPSGGNPNSSSPEALPEIAT